MYHSKGRNQTGHAGCWTAGVSSALRYSVSPGKWAVSLETRQVTGPQPLVGQNSPDVLQEHHSEFLRD